MVAPLPANETERLAAVLSCGVLDTAPEPAFDDIAQLASQLCGTPIALVTIVDRSRQWFKAKVGVMISESPREHAFCAHAIAGDEPLIVPNAHEDARFAENPYVIGAPFIRFYAGVPLVLDDGLAVGTLCVLDVVERELTARQVDGLKRLARQVTRELNLRRRLALAAASRITQPWSEAADPHADESRETLVDTHAKDDTSSTRDEAARLSIPLGSVLEGRYRLDGVLGVGGMGLVVRGTSLETGKPVAIKFMLAEALASHERRERFVREAQALLKMDVEHVARVLDVGNLPTGEPYIVMEYLDGEDLAQRLRARGKLPWPEAVDIVLGICAAVESAHVHGILHRDLKPANVFLVRDSEGRERVKVLDFGVSKLWGEHRDSAPTGLTNTATMLGTPQYMSPEQMIGRADVDERTDVWSLGVILFELIAGKPPFVGEAVVELCAKIIATPAPSLASGRAELPPALCQLVARCLAKRPEERPRSVRELADALRTLRSSYATTQMPASAP